MSDTPRTDAAVYLTRGKGFNAVDPNFARELERENTALRADKALLDALDRNAVVRERTLAIMERGSDNEPIRWAGIEWDGREVGIREAIREAAEGKVAK